MGIRRFKADNYSVFDVIERGRVVVMRVLYSASDIRIRRKTAPPQNREVSAKSAAVRRERQYLP